MDSRRTGTSGAKPLRWPWCSVPNPSLEAISLDTTTPVVPTVVLRWYPAGDDHPEGAWRYQWWDYTIDFVGGNVPTHEQGFPSMVQVLPALLADTARALTTGTG